MAYKLGSLFDGSGGFPLAGALCDIVPTWASEVEPYPIAVTRSRFPNMKHLGSVTDIHGGEVEPVDIITFGSPCQDLSVAGKRAGIRHEANGDEETTRSGLFMEAVRIIKEMREATGGEYPSFALWENVPGAFSSSKGEDFRVVLEELIGIVEPGAVVPPVPKGGWAYADSYTGDGWSLAYRVFDAQHWGVPQRRRRIHLVLDLRGQRAREVLFEREGVRGYFEARGAAGEGAAEDAQGSPAADDRAGEGYGTGGRGLDGVGLVFNEAYQHHGWRETETVAGTLTAGQNDTVRGDTPLIVSYSFDARGNGDGETVGITGDHNRRITDYTSVVVEGRAKVYESHPMDSRVKEVGEVSPTISTKRHKGAADTPLVLEGKHAYSLQGNTIDRNAKQNGLGVCEGIAHTLNSVDRHGVAYCVGNGQLNQMSMAEQANTLDCMHDKQAVVIAAGVDCRNMNEYPELYPTLQAKPNGGQSLNFSGACRVQYIVRRLTPTECARLQGFPDTWGHPDKLDSLTPEEYRFWLEVRNTHAAINGKQTKEYTEAQMLKWYNGLHTDSAEYKMWGNGIALPPALYCLQGIADALNREDEDDWML